MMYECSPDRLLTRAAFSKYVVALLGARTNVQSAILIYNLKS